MLKLAIGSNGMAAGNTIFEAIFQGICELMERWGAAEIYYNQLTPPTVLRSYLKKYDEEYGIIENIEKSGTYRVIVKDFSANKRIPTLGLIIINQKLNKYKLNVGSDTSFQVALSRCLTEIHQGFRNEELFDSKLLDIPKKEAKYFISNDESSVYERYIEFSNFTKDNSGVFPCALFKTKPSYDFDPGVFTSRKDYETEVKDLITYFYKNLCRRIYRLQFFSTY